MPVPEDKKSGGLAKVMSLAVEKLVEMDDKFMKEDIKEEKKELTPIMPEKVVTFPPAKEETISPLVVEIEVPPKPKMRSKIERESLKKPIIEPALPPVDPHQAFERSEIKNEDKQIEEMPDEQQHKHIESPDVENKEDDEDSSDSNDSDGSSIPSEPEELTVKGIMRVNDSFVVGSDFVISQEYDYMQLG